MYGDFSRVSFSRSSDYSGVFAQQGRVQLDADLNEQTAIVLEYLRTLTMDFIGPFGGHTSAGFEVGVSESGGKQEITVSDGHYYVYGLRCESRSPDGAGRRFELALPEPPYFVELLVWEQAVNAIQDPRLVEPALGEAAATTVRSQVRWKVAAGRTLPHSADEVTGSESPARVVECFVKHHEETGPRPMLRARAVDLGGTTGPDPLLLATANGYRGVENQLYRVEVHTGGDADDATFKWSRDNGSVEVAIDSLSGVDADGDRIAGISGRWRDARGGLELGDWVELIDDTWRPGGRPGGLMCVHGVDLVAGEVKLSAPSAGAVAFDAALHPLLRRWDQKPDLPAADHAMAIVEVDGDGDDDDDDGEWLDLEDGVQVQFVGSGARYQRGDYWLLPARTATGGLLWPGTATEPEAVPPDGPVRYRAPLALVRSSTAGDVKDLRHRFAHLPGHRREREHEG